MSSKKSFDFEVKDASRMYWRFKGSLDLEDMARCKNTPAGDFRPDDEMVLWHVEVSQPTKKSFAWFPVRTKFGVRPTKAEVIQEFQRVVAGILSAHIHSLENNQKA